MVLVFARPEPQSFTKFVISVGVFLCIAAFIAPALVLRETGVLTISKHELDGLTPVGRAELLRRQHVETSVARAAPFGGLALFVGGVLLILYGAPGLRRQEQVEQARSSVELDKLRSELEPQSESERRASLEADIDEDTVEATMSPGVPVLVPGRPRPTSIDEGELGERIRRAREIEEAVLERIATLVPPHYELHRNVVVADSGARRLSLDGLLISTRDGDPDVVLEIKSRSVRSQVPPNPRPAVSDVLLALTRYRARVGRRAVGWLVFVIDEADRSRFSRVMEAFAEELREDLAVTVVASDGISHLDFPSFG